MRPLKYRKPRPLIAIDLTGTLDLAVRMAQLPEAVVSQLKAASGDRMGGSDGCTYSSGTFLYAEKCECGYSGPIWC